MPVTSGIERTLAAWFQPSLLKTITRFLAIWPSLGAYCHMGKYLHGCCSESVSMCNGSGNAPQARHEAPNSGRKPTHTLTSGTCRPGIISKLNMTLPRKEDGWRKGLSKSSLPPSCSFRRRSHIECNISKLCSRSGSVAFFFVSLAVSFDSQLSSPLD